MSDIALILPEWEMMPKTRAEARELGVNRYFTGVPCKNGHVSPRKTSDKACLVCQKNHIRKWRREHADRVNELCRKRANLNIEKHRLQKRIGNKRRRLQNPEKARADSLANSRKRYAMRKGAEGKYSQADLDRIRKQQKDRCGACSIKLRNGGHIDHIIALSKGGTNWPSNIQFLCVQCNTSKKASDPLDFMRSKGRLL